MSPLDLIATGRLAGYVVAAYLVSGAGLLGLTGWSLARAAYWKRRASRGARVREG